MAQTEKRPGAISAVCESRGLQEAFSILRARAEGDTGAIPYQFQKGNAEGARNGPIAVEERWYPAEHLSCGWSEKGCAVSFSHRRYQDRRPEAREDYDRLIVDLYHNGMKNPLIVWRGHILIGMRRFEILQNMGVDEFRCWEILEDIREWDRYDIPRLNALKDEYNPASY